MKKKGKLSSSMRRFLWGMLYLTMVLGIVGCSSSQETFKSTGDKVKITTTIGMIADVAEQVGGEHVEVLSLMKSGVDPHLYKATQSAISKLNKADLIFYNGLHLEGKMGDILEKMNKNKPTIAVSRNLDVSKLRGMEDNSTEHDPHIWFDVRNWMSATEVIRDELVKIDSANADQYKSNAAAYLKQLQALHEEVGTKIASIPKNSRILVTAHDAFGYFGAAYDIQVMGLQGISTASEAGLKDVTDLRNFLVDNKVKAVFVESSVPKKTIQAVVDGAKEKGHEVKIGGELFSDAMGAAGTIEGTYIGMVKHNVDTIVSALK
ncbi:MAG: periplasmic solute binding protein [Paenibacillus sp.]|nr:periplasmic solute binding protein [Paenibacillus sp.]